MKKDTATVYVLFVLLFLAVCFSLSVSVASGEEFRAKAAVVMDAESGKVLFAKNPERRLFPASTTKLMTALVVLDRMHPDEVVAVSGKAASVSATRLGLRHGDTITIGALLHAALIKSANDAAVTLAEAVAGSEEAFIELMNSKAASLGLSNTRFINSNGLPGPGQYTTALELAEIMREALRLPLLREILGTRVAEVTTSGGWTKIIRNTNQLLWSDRELMLGKTGYTRDAQHCFVGAGDYENGILIVALLGEPVRGLLWSEAESLMAFGVRVINNLEEPVVYITRSDLDSTKLQRASHSVKKQKVRKNKIRKKRSGV